MPPNPPTETEATVPEFKALLMPEAEGTAHSLQTTVSTIREYALPELPPNEKGQVPFLHVVFVAVIAEIEAFLVNHEAELATLRQQLAESQAEVERLRMHSCEGGCRIDAEEASS